MENDWSGPRNRYIALGLLVTSTLHQNISLIVTTLKGLGAFLRANNCKRLVCCKNYVDYLPKPGNYSSTIVSLV